MAAPREVKSVPLVRVTRGGVQDNLHRGSAAAVDDRGEVLLSFGDPGSRAYIRSAAKPIQALPVLLSGAAEAYGFDDADVAIMCGSHAGGEGEVRRVRAILAKAGLPEELLRSGTGIADNCSGKHAGMLAASKLQGLDLQGYLDREHPHQRRILETVAAVCGAEPGEIVTGTDGCGAPIHCLTLAEMALGYARLAAPERHFDADTSRAARRIIRAMAANPGGSTGEPDYAGTLGDARFLTKAGGSGVYCAGVVDRGIGLAMKVEDGSGVPLKVVFTEVMRRLGVLSEDEAGKIAASFWPAVVNRRGHKVGEIEILLPS